MHKSKSQAGTAYVDADGNIARRGRLADGREWTIHSQVNAQETIAQAMHDALRRGDLEAVATIWDIARELNNA